VTLARAVVIRPESEADFAAIREVNEQAFARDGRLGTDEADLVEALRRNGNSIVSLVAVLEGEVVGHVMFSPMTIRPATGGEYLTIALAPLAVHPRVQNQGIGGALLNAGLEEIRELGHDAVFLLGHPTYYPRFGFAPARHRGIIYQDGRDSFQVIELRPGALDGISGTAHFSPEFAPYE
jgi:putative acetyltransferase